MTNQVMANALLEMANEVGTLIARASGEQFFAAYEAGQQLLKSVEALGFAYGVDFEEDVFSGDFVWIN